MYPNTPALIDWLSHTLLPIEQSEFHHWRGIKTLVKTVHASNRGDVPCYAAMNAVEQYNEQNGTLITYEEVSALDHTHIPCGVGEWAVWTDNQTSLLCGDYDDPWEAFSYANEDVGWVVVQLPSEPFVIVFRSPYTGRRLEDDEGTINGLEFGEELAYILPPEIEASLKQDLDPSMPETVRIDRYPLHNNPNDLQYS